MSFNSLFEIRVIRVLLVLPLWKIKSFQFSFWDSNWEAGGMGEMNHFQFSFWDSSWGGEAQDAPGAGAAFQFSFWDSQLTVTVVGAVTYICFQFSFWDSDHHRHYSYGKYVQYLSILFLRFLPRSSSRLSWTPCLLSILFLRFYYMLRWFEVVEWETFNSLFEIPRQRHILDAQRRHNFQFSFWDSDITPGYRFIRVLSAVTFNSLFEIPAARWGWGGMDDDNFQFSFWDSVEAAAWDFNGMVMIFQFSFWDSRSQRQADLDAENNFQFSFWDSSPYILLSTSTSNGLLSILFLRFEKVITTCRSRK